MMTLEDRAASYSEAFPKYPPLMVSGGWLYGVWMIGNQYASRTGYHGEYPASYLNRVHSLFPDAKRVLHLFSGMVDVGRWPVEITIDRNESTKPDVICDVSDKDWIHWTLGMQEDKTFEFHLPQQYDLVLADPPYTEEDATKYGTTLVNRNAVVSDCAQIVRPGGFLVWLDQVYPMWRKTTWNAVGTIGIWRSTNHRFRGVTIFQRKQASHV